MFNELYYGRQEMKVSPGDRFALFSDGLIERAAVKKVRYECLPGLLEACPHIKNITINILADELSSLMIDKTSKPEDDIMVLGVEV